MSGAARLAAPLAASLAATQPVPKFRLAWSDASCLWSLAPRHAADAEAGLYAHKLTRDSTLAFEIVAPAARLDALLVTFATYGRANDAPVWCDLHDRAGAVLARGIVETADLADNTEREILDLRDVAFTVGERYTIRLSSPAGTDANSVAAWVVPVPEGRYELHRRITDLSRRRTFVYAEGEAEGRGREGERLRCVLAVAPVQGRVESRAAVALLDRCLPGQPFEIVPLDEVTAFWPTLAGADVVVFAGIPEDGGPAPGFDALCFALHRRGVCTVAAETSDLVPLPPGGAFAYGGWLSGHVRQRHQTHRRCHFVLQDGAEPALIDSVRDEAVTPGRWPATPAASRDLLAGLVERVRAGRLPHVAIVSVLYRKADIIETFLDHAVAQTYPGPITVVLVDDRSPDRDAALARAYGEALEGRGVPNRRVIVQENADNLGNCASRLAGLAAVGADLAVIIDCDCLISRDFVAAHVFEHWWDDVDAVIGPLNIESGARDVREVAALLEAEPWRVAEEAEPQDPVQPDGFLNCITRNFSVKRRRLDEEPLFDLDFSYSAKPGSGFGWEDVEMGYRLYARGAVIRFTDLAFSVHASHDSSMPEARKVLGSMRNFERLFAKHPDMELVARRWAVDTYDRIASWAGALGVDGGEVQRSLERRFAPALAERGCLLPLYRRGHRPLRVLTYRWHAPHQYELYKLPHQFHLVTGLGNPMIDRWAFEQRPLRPNVTMIPADRVDPRRFDVALLHFDENVLASQLCNGVIPAQWGDPFRWFLGLEGIPKVAICHGTAQFLGQYGLDPARKHAFTLYEEERRRLVGALDEAGAAVVCNSHEAEAEWGFARSRVIWHGFDPQEFPAGTQARDVLALDADRHRPHYRGAWEHERVLDLLDPGIRVETARHRGAALEIRDGNAFAVRNFRAYVDRIRQFTLYLNTTLRSPMPRSRGEAMMTGVIPVCLRNHDVDRFIEPGRNGFYADTPEELADYVNYLCRNRAEARRIGAGARRTALDLFNHDRYLAAWTRLLDEVTG